jgi:hypothetical protein
MILFRKNRYMAPATADYELSLIVEKKKHDFFFRTRKHVPSKPRKLFAKQHGRRR